MKVARNCPVCGEKPRIVRTTDVVTGKTRGYYIYCPSGIQKQTHRIDTVTCRSLEKAVDIWNGDYYEGRVYADG